MIVRPEQIKSLEDSARQRFEDEMVIHSKSFSPRLSQVIGDEQVRVAVRSAMERASGYGFTYRGSVQLFIEMCFQCGSSFDTDPQYPAIGAVLASQTDQMERAERIYEGYLTYLERVSGPGARNVHKALKDLLSLSEQPLRLQNGFEPGVLHELNRVFPQKSSYTGLEGLKALIAQGKSEAAVHGFNEDRQAALIVILKFAFGHGCTDDPLYPWIKRTLDDRRIVSPKARAARLEKKALTWLKHVVARNEKGLPS